jgi:GTP-binding protein YchF
VEIVDIAGLVKGASKGEGLGNKFLANIRETDAILHVLRCFEDGNVVHVDGSVDPIRDKEVIDMELQLKDLETVEARAAKIRKAAATGDKEAARTAAVYDKVKETLERGISARAVDLDEAERPILRDLQLLTAKPVMYVCNVEETSVATGNAHVDRVREMAATEGSAVLVIGAAIEAEIAELEDPEERALFLGDLGLVEPGVAVLIRKAYELLQLQTYFRRRQRGPGLDHPQGLHGPRGRRGHPFGLSERIHPCRGHRLRGLHLPRIRIGGQRSREVGRGGQGIRCPRR